MAPPVEQPSLTVLSGSMGGTVFIVDDSIDNILIGSDASCSFALPGTGVDPIHARLWIDLEGITVYDTDSPRGVYINDDRVQGQARLRNGDILWLGPPGEDRSVMLQCRLPGAQPAAAGAPPPNVEPTVAMMAIDLDPTVSLLPAPVVAPGPAMEAVPDDAPEDPDSLLAPDAIQPEPTVTLATEDAFTEPEATIAMLPDDLEISEDAAVAPEPTANVSGRIEEPSPKRVTGWDPIGGGMTAASDAPWMAGAPASAAAPDPAATIAPGTAIPVPAGEPAPPPVPPAVKPTAPPAPPPARAPERPPTPKRREAPPATPAPAPRRPERARPPDDEPGGPPPRRGAPMGLLIGGGLVAAAATAAGGWWMLSRGPAAPASNNDAAPPTVAAARPATPRPAVEDLGVSRPPPDVPVEEEVTIVPPPRAVVSPVPVPSRAPALTPPPTQVAAAPMPPPVTAAPVAPPPAVVAAGLAGRAEAARRAGDLDVAAQLFDQALRADPRNAAATSGKAAVAAARAAARKAFMPGRTVVLTQSAKADMAGFDTADVSVKKAPDFSGRIEFAMSPARVKPGDQYSVQIYLVNGGKKTIKVSGVSVTTNLNGSKSGGAVPSRVKEVDPGQRALLEEISGVWPEEVTWWSTEVIVTANKGDSLKNVLTWR